MNLLALWVTLKLAAIVAVLLMIVGLPLGARLSNSPIAAADCSRGGV
jgi:hypothetical protein